jgi:hypothetical protein
MAGHKTWCRFNNSRVFWSYCGHRFPKDRSESISAYTYKRGFQAKSSNTVISGKAAPILSSDEPINKMEIYWPKEIKHRR